MTPHPTGCYTLPGHERCALSAAAGVAEDRAERHRLRARQCRNAVRAMDDGGEVSPGELLAAWGVLGVAPQTSVVRIPAGGPR